ncbi:hypothetical protein [Kribbella sp.]|uniref:hypothetical protein n=1 Tax=Kribbella sp. TaxID=1871183 RepID=UPI002D73769E|nr:hypothetical protein [Kribbella sp.]HZX04898.1 hypothetical protein [Kribbella sp.]
MNLRVRVLNCGRRRWYADIDDADDPQPDDPFWYVDHCRSQAQALETACAELRLMAGRLVRGDHLGRVLEI